MVYKRLFCLWLGVLFLRKPYFLGRWAKFLHNWFFLHVFCPFIFAFFFTPEFTHKFGRTTICNKKVTKFYSKEKHKKTSKNKFQKKKKEKNWVKKNTAKLLQMFFLKIVYNSFNKTLQVNYMVINFAEWY